MRVNLVMLIVLLLDPILTNISQPHAAQTLDTSAFRLPEANKKAIKSKKQKGKTEANATICIAETKLSQKIQPEIK